MFIVFVYENFKLICCGEKWVWMDGKLICWYVWLVVYFIDFLYILVVYNVVFVYFVVVIVVFFCGLENYNYGVVKILCFG